MPGEAEVFISVRALSKVGSFKSSGHAQRDCSVSLSLYIQLKCNEVKVVSVNLSCWTNMG